MTQDFARHLEHVQEATMLKQEGATGQSLRQSVQMLSEDVMENWPTVRPFPLLECHACPLQSCLTSVLRLCQDEVDESLFKQVAVFTKHVDLQASNAGMFCTVFEQHALHNFGLHGCMTGMSQLFKKPTRCVHQCLTTVGHHGYVFFCWCKSASLYAC